MNINFNNLPVGSLPYEDIQLCKQMMLRLYEDVPFLPELPLIDSNDEVYHKTIQNIPCIEFKDGKLIITESTNEKLMQYIMHLEKKLVTDYHDELVNFETKTPFFPMYIEILKRLKPKTTVINLVGPFTLSNSIFNKNGSIMLLDKNYRKFIAYSIIFKALWFMSKIKEASPETKPLIMFDERLLYKFGTLKRTNENITNETVVTLFSRIFSKLKKEGALIGVQSFEKCNWQLVFDSENVDIISYDAYNNPSNLNILAKSVNKFLAKGGYVNWGIVPVMNENVIRSLNISMIHDRFKATMEALIADGVSADLIQQKSTVSVQGNVSHHQIIFAEKAVILANQLGKKLPVKK